MELLRKTEKKEENKTLIRVEQTYSGVLQKFKHKTFVLTKTQKIY